MNHQLIDDSAGPPSVPAEARRLSVDRIPGVIFHALVPDAGRPHLTYVSPQAEELFGQRVDPRAPDWGLAARIHEGDRVAFWEAATAAARSRSMLRHEARCRTPAGELKWIQCVATPTAREEGIAYEGYLLDVTEAKRAEAEIHRLSAVVEQMGDALMITDRFGVIQYVNPAFEEHLGYSKEEIVGKSPRVLKSGIHEPAFYRALWETVLAGKVYRGPMINRHKDGRLVHEEKTISPLRDEAGRIVLFIATSTDVTAHRAAEAEVRRSEERYRSFVANTSEGIWRMESAEPVLPYLDAPEQADEILSRFRLAECNDAFARMHGRTRAGDLLGAEIGALLAPQGTRDPALFRAFVEGGHAIKDHVTTLTVNGEKHFLKSSFNGEIELGGLVRIWGVTRDVTAERKAKESLRAMNEELERRVAERTEALGRANERLSRLATEDPLTALANRRRFNETLALEVRRALRRNDPISLLMCDVDHFKLYNDHFGHLEGDRCLELVAKALIDTFRRAEDLPARYGGEEFAVILPGLAAGAASTLAERLRERIQALAIPHPRSETAPFVTVSIGIASACVTEARDARWFVAQADLAMYASKGAGRDRVTISGV